MKINGLPVFDAKETIVLRINKTDVKDGRVKDPHKCAAALACMRQLHVTDARVHVGRTYVRRKGHWDRYLTSPALRSEIVSFDRGGRFEPGEYTLLKIQPSRKGDTSRDTRKRKPGHKVKKRMPYHMLTEVRPVAHTGVTKERRV